MIPKSTTLVFLGRSGCGKDTQIEFLLKRPEFKDAVKFISGDNFRKLAQESSTLGRKVKEILDAGGLIPYWLPAYFWIDSLREKVRNDEIFILSGSPRRFEETRFLDEVLEFIGRPKAVAILLEIRPEEVKKRLLLRARADDTEERIKKRLGWYETEVIQTIEYYRKEKRLVEVDGEPKPEIVFQELEEKLEKYFG
jgi:adenylate kinase